ncbi:MAG: hypothetical protein COA92_04605 [Sulfurovum sp.]|nr:MAG: hypothetical protein COA92_04605 [Sulfurovum sp.]
MTKVLAALGVIFILGSTSATAATAATVNGMKITVEETNKALEVLTKGKMTWNKLPKDGKTQLIQMMAPSKLVSAAAKKELTTKEKEAALSGFWMQKRMSKMSISDKMAKSAYEKMKKAAKAAKSKEKIPPFEKAKQSIKIQLAQEEIVSGLMKKANIKIK